MTASADSTGRVYNVHTGECIAELVGHSGEISKVSFNPSGNQIITGSADCTAKILLEFINHLNIVLILVN